MKRTKQVAQQNIVRSDRRKRRKHQDHHLLPAAFLLCGVECAMCPQKTPGNPRERPDQIGKQNRPDSLEAAKPHERGSYPEQKKKEKYTHYPDKHPTLLLFLPPLR